MTHFQDLAPVFSELGVSTHTNQGITVCNSLNNIHGFKIAKAVLEKVLTKTSVLYLSGGKTPKELYVELAEEELILPGVVALVDERFGLKWHEKSNEKMVQDTGLFRYLEMRGIPYHLILCNPESLSGSDGLLNQAQHDMTREETAEAYDSLFRTLNVQYQKQVAILGVGIDGHTAGIGRNHDGFENPMFDPSQITRLVSDFDDKKGGMGERISMTFTGLSMIDLNIVLVFGPEKGEALEKMFSSGSEEEIPARFFKRPDIAARTLVITDQIV